MKVAIVTITKDNYNYLEKYLDCLIKNTDSAMPHLYELVLIDNNSTPENMQKNFKLLTEKMANKTYTYIYNNKMYSFAENCNKGAMISRSQLIAFVNDDTEPQPDWLKNMVSFMDTKKDCVVVGPKMYFKDGLIQHCGIAFRETPHLHAGHIWFRKKSKDDPEVNVPRKFQAVTGGCMLIKRHVFNNLGGFDENYKVAGYEDIDLCLRIGDMQNHGIWYCPTAELIHHESTTQNKFSPEFRNQYFVENHKFWLGRWGFKLKTDYHEYEPGVY